jgi:hypothetical protein
MKESFKIECEKKNVFLSKWTESGDFLKECAVFQIIRFGDIILLKLEKCDL